ncbi:bifunctional ornithine acetyltransferase/N-acetylglutamate synthase [Archaeoglobus neptunius]|uniref:bifunctional ornithine acetyltransferase/N-acetylglutamate synthase n=1 Tax=Archaeoglobus neptunius TaxID=2798580 RepID=UPI001927DDB6|nr:bifunctional ornithine acetyltransferase/N-acetylglutamate synthase [Archaeoglobus neptunius]
MEITDIDGVFCNGVKEGKLGLGIVRCRGNVAGVFTRNRLKAAPVLVCRENIDDGHIEGIIVNSGNANAYTGEQGLRDAREMCRIAASLFGCSDADVAVASTGVIGRPLDMEWIRSKAPEIYARIGKSGKHAENFARSIVTTDRFVKKAHSDVGLISAVAKGAGMIAPNMATMLCFIFTSASFDSGELYEMLKKAVDRSFNRLTVDGDTSTNDTVLIVSTGKEKVDRDVFEGELWKVCYSLAKQIAMDGEGATKTFDVVVSGAASDDEANAIARAIASSLLVKTAIFGCDPNWGRIIAAAGYSSADVDERITLSLKSGDREVLLVDDGRPTGNEEEARNLLKTSNSFVIEMKLEKGRGKGFAIGCDLSYDYVKLNSEYTT